MLHTHAEEKRVRVRYHASAAIFTGLGMQH